MQRFVAILFVSPDRSRSQKISSSRSQNRFKRRCGFGIFHRDVVGDTAIGDQRFGWRAEGSGLVVGGVQVRQEGWDVGIEIGFGDGGWD